MAEMEEKVDRRSNGIFHRGKCFRDSKEEEDGHTTEETAETAENADAEASEAEDTEKKS